MRIVMLGTGPFAVPTLEALAKSQHEVALVVSRPKKGRTATASPLQRAGEALAIETWSPETVNSPDAQQRLAACQPDLLVVCDYGEILKPETIKTARLGGINLHGSLLPKYRGAAPVQWAILRGETETGNSVIQMTPGLDAGPCLGQQRTPIDPDEDAGQLEARLANLGADLVCQIVAQLAAGSAKSIVQDAGQATKAPRLRKSDGAIDWSRPAQEIKNRIRAVRPWPRAFTYWRRETGAPLRLNVDRVAVADAASRHGDVASAPEPGSVIEEKDRLLIMTGDEPLAILEIQPAGKRSMSGGEFVRGYRPTPGERWGHEEG